MSHKQPAEHPEFLKITIDILESKRFLLFIVAYNAEHHIRQTLERIPETIRHRFSEILIIDDSSQDQTIAVAKQCSKKLGLTNCTILKTPVNQGYGGNQKIGYTYAIEKNFDHVILLHADGQYPPEFLPHIIQASSHPEYAGIFGSRMMTPLQALKGGMPLYKWVGNIILTTIENVLMGSRLSEFHSGYRSYQVNALKQIFFLKNSDDFHFDTDIIIQLFAQKLLIKEVPMPTHYGNEICRVNGLKYAWNCIKSVIKYRLHRIGLFYQPSLETATPTTRHDTEHQRHNTLHHFVRTLPWKASDVVANLGAGGEPLVDTIAAYVSSITAIDIERSDASLPNTQNMILAVSTDFSSLLNKTSFDKVLALDIIEHLSHPEQAVQSINIILKNGGTVYASTANIAYIVMRLTHLVGWFHYSKRGILDQDHHRLFTISSFKHLFKTNGFQIQKVIGFGPPIADQISSIGIIAIIDTISGKLARLYPSLFAFNFLIIAHKKTAFKDIYSDTLTSSEHLS